MASYFGAIQPIVQKSSRITMGRRSRETLVGIYLKN